MASYIVDPADISDAVAVLTGEEAHHAARAARRKEGEIIWLVDGRGTAYEARVESAGKDRVECTVLRTFPDWGEPNVSVTLAAAPVKGGRFDTVVEKAVELGANHIIPLETAHSVVKNPSEGKLSRWRSLARAATKQCRRSRVPEITGGMTMDELIWSVHEYDHVFVAWVGESRRSLADYGHLTGRVLVVIGPEGGFTDEEVDALRNAGAESVTLGPRRLRAETAAIVALTLVLDRGGEMARSMSE